jgi:hypothetical protein
LKIEVVFISSLDGRFANLVTLHAIRPHLLL